MLQDRRELLEYEIRKAHQIAADMYFSIIKSGDVHSEEYQDLKDHIASLQFDLNCGNQLIHKGK